MGFGTVRTRFALLYAGAFAVSGLLVLAVVSFSAKATVHVGSAGPPVVTHPFAQALGQVTSVVVSLAVLAVLSVAFGWLLAGRLLRPVRVITATARDISASNLSRRLRLGRRDDEFTRLGETLNDLFGRLEAAFDSQRHFVANASHELRTPLTAERTLLQVALADPDADAGTLRNACKEVLALGEQTERLIEALLTLASSEQGIEQREPFDFAELARKIVDGRREEAARKGIKVSATLAAAPAAGDPSLAESLLANLVDNALRYNVAGGRVEISAGTIAGRAFVSVSNTGPVISPGEVDHLFQPFRRLGSERIRNAGGHGLGLAIVRAIAGAHGAALTARARPEGGLDIEVSFPLRVA
jgi:signal transduction histidine kinase